MKATVKGSTPEALTKRAVFLAWQACGGALGMGAFQDAPSSKEEDVWANIMGAGDYPGDPSDLPGFRHAGEAYADYVFGRMMKLCVKYNDAGVEIDGDDWRRDYQAFCGKYPDGRALLTAAAESLGCELVVEK